MIYTDYPGVVLKLGDTGENIELVQSAINIIFQKYPIYNNLDEKGIFGEDTEKSVKEIQRAVDIDINGIIDKKTWDTIFAIAGFISEC